MRPSIHKKLYRQFLNELPILVGRYIRFVNGNAPESTPKCDPEILRALQAKQNLSGCMLDYGYKRDDNHYYRRDFESQKDIHRALAKENFQTFQEVYPSMFVNTISEAIDDPMFPLLQIKEYRWNCCRPHADENSTIEHHKRYQQFLQELPMIVNQYARFVNGKADEPIPKCDPHILRALRAKQNFSDMNFPKEKKMKVADQQRIRRLYDRDSRSEDQVDEALWDAGYEVRETDFSRLAIRPSDQSQKFPLLKVETVKFCLRCRDDDDDD